MPGRVVVTGKIHSLAGVRPKAHLTEDMMIW